MDAPLNPPTEPPRYPRGLPEGRYPAQLEGRSLSRVLVALDQSPEARRALDQAIDLAQVNGAGLTIITVAPSLGWVASAGASAVAESGSYVAPVTQQEIDHDYEVALDEAAHAIPEPVSVRRVVAHGKAGPAIVEEADAGDHDLIVMGSRGRGELRSWLLGSVSHHVLRESAVPVLMVHGWPEVFDWQIAGDSGSPHP
jgi:nucleotide-binding universal stress UspA family protein